MFYSLIMKCKKNIKILFFLLFSFVSLNGCNPNTSETTIYTSDFEEVKNATTSAYLSAGRGPTLLKYFIEPVLSLHTRSWPQRCP